MAVFVRKCSHCNGLMSKFGSFLKGEHYFTLPLVRQSSFWFRKQMSVLPLPLELMKTCWNFKLTVIGSSLILFFRNI